MQGLLNAISGGYSAKEVLNFLSRQFPELGPQIKNAISAGYTIDQVINFLEKGVGKKETEAYKKNSKGKKPIIPFEDDNPYNQAKKNLERPSTEQGGSAQSKFLSKLPGILGNTALGVAGGLGASALMKSSPLLGSLSTIGENLMKGTNPSPPSTPPIAGPLDQTQGNLQPATQPNIQQPEPVQQAEQPKQEEYDLARAKDLYEKWKKTNRALPLAKVMKTNLGVSDDTAIKIAQDLKASDKPESPFSRGSLQETLNREDEPIKEEKPIPQIKKGDLAALADGVFGDIKGIDKSGVLVDVEGKIKKFPKDEVITSPIPSDELADLYQGLINKIPEKDRSGMINQIGYDPNVNELLFIPHTGAKYVYKDIPPEFAEKLKNALFKAKTTGSNLYGAWTEGEDSRGAGLSQLIKELQSLYGGKGNEYVRKYETVYDIFAPAKEAVKQKLKRESDERKKAKSSKTASSKETSNENKIRLEIDRLKKDQEISKASRLSRDNDEENIKKTLKKDALQEYKDLDESLKEARRNKDKKSIDRISKRREKLLENDEVFKYILTPSGKTHTAFIEHEPSSENKNLSSTLPKPTKGNLEYKTPKGEVIKEPSDIYDGIFSITKRDGYYVVSHVPTGASLATYKTKKSALELMKDLFEEDLIDPKYVHHKTMEEAGLMFKNRNNLMERINKHRNN